MPVSGDVGYYDLDDFARTGQSLFLRKGAQLGKERSLTHNVEVIATDCQIIAKIGDELFTAVSSADPNTEYLPIARSRS